MPEIEFTGEWSRNDATAIASTVQGALEKSLGVGDGGGAEVSVQQLDDNPIPEYVSKRQRDLIGLLRQAGEKAFSAGALSKAAERPIEHECGPGCTHSWEDYQIGAPLLKAFVGQVKTTQHGTYRYNANNRWERFSTNSGPALAERDFKFPIQDGFFGRGVYFPIASGESGYMRLRVKLHISPNGMISDEEFFQIEDNFAADLGLTLDKKGVHAIAQTESDRVTLLCIRDPEDIEVLGAVDGSGQLPPGGAYDFHLVRFNAQDDGFTVDLEVVPGGEVQSLQGQELIKAARVLQGTQLAGSQLNTVSSPKIPRETLRHAVKRCKLDGVPCGDIQIRVVDVIPDFLPNDTKAYCLPGEGTVYLVHHDIPAAIRERVRMITRELRSLMQSGVIPPQDAVNCILHCQEIDEDWWLETLIKRYVGSILIAQKHCPLSSADPVGPWREYIGLLAGRGLQHWCDRKLLMECMAEDYRCAYDPSGFPNQVTLAYDLAVPQLARMCQQKLIQILGQENSQSAEQVPAWPSFGDRPLLP